ncbi:shikimate dehydrogenase [Ramlibacter sp. MMS24-I3-19]|uniref:shikimate dehydrogenase n=1 Tax=Ramlibacter sp. MMS24-I3-19 TaxID=3416606 RepID=UPI003D0550A6
MSADRYAVVGHPVEHSKSPWIHARFAALTGQAVQYDKLLAPLDGFVETIARFRASGGRGCNVTVPFKFEAIALATAVSDRARLAGACNTLRFDGTSVYGDNTDGVGLVRDIEQGAGRAIAGQRVLLVGAGGAAAGVLGPLLQARPAGIVVANRTVAKAQTLADSHAALAAQAAVPLQACSLDALQALGAFDMVVNATASSLAGDAVPVPASVLRPGSLAVDLMYGAAAQGFLAWARRHGAEPRDGLGMLVEQAAESFAVWRGVRPPTSSVLRDLRALLQGG